MNKTRNQTYQFIYIILTAVAFMSFPALSQAQSGNSGNSDAIDTAALSANLSTVNTYQWWTLGTLQGSPNVRLPANTLVVAGNAPNHWQTKIELPPHLRVVDVLFMEQYLAILMGPEIQTDPKSPKVASIAVITHQELQQAANNVITVAPAARNYMSLMQPSRQWGPVDGNIFWVGSYFALWQHGSITLTQALDSGSVARDFGADTTIHLVPHPNGFPADHGLLVGDNTITNAFLLSHAPGFTTGGAIASQGILLQIRNHHIWTPHLGSQNIVLGGRPYNVVKIRQALLLENGPMAAVMDVLPSDGSTTLPHQVVALVTDKTFAIYGDNVSPHNHNPSELYLQATLADSNGGTSPDAAFLIRVRKAITAGVSVNSVLVLHVPNDATAASVNSGQGTTTNQTIIAIPTNPLALHRFLNSSAAAPQTTPLAPTPLLNASGIDWAPTTIHGPVPLRPEQTRWQLPHTVARPLTNVNGGARDQEIVRLMGAIRNEYTSLGRTESLPTGDAATLTIEQYLALLSWSSLNYEVNTLERVDFFNRALAQLRLPQFQLTTAPSNGRPQLAAAAPAPVVGNVVPLRKFAEAINIARTMEAAAKAAVCDGILGGR